MTDLLQDTNAYTAMVLDDSDAADVCASANRLMLNPVVLAELQLGGKLGRRRADNDAKLRAFLAQPHVRVLPIDEGTADACSDIMCQLRRAGTPIPANDMWIAATAIQHGLALFTYDQHFRHVSGLRFGARMADFA